MVPYPKFVQFVGVVCALSVRRTRLENLQRLTYGLLRGRSCCLSRIARFFPMSTDHNHRLRRLWRFLRNPGFIPGALLARPAPHARGLRPDEGFWVRASRGLAALARPGRAAVGLCLPREVAGASDQP